MTRGMNFFCQFCDLVAYNGNVYRFAFTNGIQNSEIHENDTHPCAIFNNQWIHFTDPYMTLYNH